MVVAWAGLPRGDEEHVVLGCIYLAFLASTGRVNNIRRQCGLESRVTLRALEALHTITLWTLDLWRLDSWQ